MIDKETNLVISQANHKERGKDDKIETKVADNEPDVATNTSDHQASDNEIVMAENETNVTTNAVDHKVNRDDKAITRTDDM